jgi:predicted small metal-binding protein
MIHRTVEEIMQMPGYCRDHYERQILKLEAKVKKANNILNEKTDHTADTHSYSDFRETQINRVKCALCHIDICIQGRVPTKECFV